MTSREVIKKVIHFDNPGRIGFGFVGYPVADLATASCRKRPLIGNKKFVRDGNMELYADEWGNTWHRVAGMSGTGEVRDPAIKDWRDVDTLQFPDYRSQERYDMAREAFEKSPDAYHIGGLPGFPFSIMRYMRKMEVFFEDVLLCRDEVDALQRRIVAVIKDAMRGLANAGADGVFFAEDWGTQDRLLVSPTLWRDLFKPAYVELCAEAHALNLDVWMHSCGMIGAIIPDLIEVGVAVLQFDQPSLHGIEALAESYGGRVAFWTPVDIQRTLQTGDREKIRAEAKLLCERLGGFGGGFIAKNYPDLHGIGVAPEWDQWAYEAFLEYGGY